MKLLHRRRFLKTASQVTATLAGWPLVSRAAQNTMPELKFPIIDTHQHLWDRQKLDLPWLKNSQPPLSENHTLKEYHAATAGLPIEQAIYMEVDAAEDQKQREAEYVLDLIAAKEQPTTAAILNADPGSRQARAFIDRYRDDARVKGFRQVLHGNKPKGYCLETKFIETCRYLAEIGKTFDLCLRPEELGDGARLAGHCQQTTFILDHCGNADPKWSPLGSEFSQWKKGIDQLAAQPNAVYKISGIVARVPAGWTAADLRPIVETCADAFGENRVVFGSDWPVCKLGASLQEWVLALNEISSTWPKDRQEKLWNHNARWIYRL